jgi:hypothetical protein
VVEPSTAWQGAGAAGHPGALTSAQWEWFEWERAQWSASSILDALFVLIGAASRPSRGKITPDPAVACRGQPPLPVSVMAELHRLLPDAQLNVIGHSQHGLPFSHAMQSAPLLRTFLDTRGSG